MTSAHMESKYFLNSITHFSTEMKRAREGAAAEEEEGEEREKMEEKEAEEGEEGERKGRCMSSLKL